MNALGFDGGIRFYGWAVADLSALLLDGGHPRITSLGTWQTEKRPGPVNKDTTRRVQTFAMHIDHLITTYRPRLMCAEETARMQRAEVTVKVNKAAAAVPILAAVNEIEFAETSAQRIKKHLLGKNSGDKLSVEAVVARFCTDEALEELRKAHPRAKLDAEHGVRSHAFDAGGSILACLADKGLWTLPERTRRAS